MSTDGTSGTGLSRPAWGAILLASLVLAGVTFFLLPALDMLSSTPPKPVEYRPVNTVAMPPPILPKAMPEEPVKPAIATVPVEPARPRPHLEEPRAALPRPRLPLRTEFSLPLPKPDLTMDFQVAQAETPLPAILESSSGAIEAPNATPTFEGDQVDSLPEPISRPQPQFPYRAKIRGIHGNLTVEFVVDENGNTTDIAILAAKPAGFFEETTLSTLRKWRFKPALKQGRPVRTRMRTTIDFKLVDN